MDLWNLLSDIVILLAASLVLGGLFARLGQSPLVGYLVAGMLLGGPGSVGAVKSPHEIEAIAELGVALLLFSLGLEFSFDRLKSLGARPLLGGALQVVVTLILGALTGSAFGLDPKAAIALGAMVSLSSTAVVLRTLMERAEIEMPHGRNSLAVLLVQDIAVVPLALLMTLLAGNASSTVMLTRIAYLLVAAAGLVVGIYVLNKIAIHLLATMTLHRNRELTVIFAVVAGLGAAWAAHAIGISPALGAFVAGMMLGSSAFATQIRADVSSLRVVLLTLFFGAAGMVANPIWIVEHWYIVAGVTLLLTIGKLAIIAAIFLALGHSMRVAAATGICLAQIGEFAFVLGSMGRANDVISEQLYALIVSATIVSFVLSAVLVPLAPKFGAILASALGSKSVASERKNLPGPAPDVVIIGFGPAGKIASRHLVDSGRHVVVIDLNQQGVRTARQLGFHGEIGDATQGEVLEHAQLARASLVVITVPHHSTAITILQLVRQLAPQTHVIARSRHQLHTENFVSAGAHAVVGDEEQVGEGLARHLQEWMKAHVLAADGATGIAS